MSTGQKLLICAIIAILCFLPSPSSIMSVDMGSENLEAHGYAGLFAYMDEVKADTDKEVTPRAICKCNGTKKISYDGGGSLVECPCVRGECDCGCMNKKPSGEAVGASADSDKKKKKRTILVTDPPNCGPCRQLDNGTLAILQNEKHKKAGWKIGNTEDCTLQVLSLSNPDDVKEIERLGLDFLAIPTFIRYNDDTPNLSGNISYEEFLRFHIGGSKTPFYKALTNRKFALNGDFNPSKTTLISHLRSGEHPEVSSWPLEILSVEDLRSLHSDCHNNKIGQIEWRDKYEYARNLREPSS